MIQRIAKRLAPKYTFGYYSRDDIEQEAIIMGLDAMSRYDPTKPLENFLNTHINNRLKTLKRDKHFRLNAGRAERAQQDKKNLMSPLSMETINPYEDNALFEDLSKKEILLKIDQELPAHMRKDFLRMCSGQKVSKVVAEKVMDTLKQILKEEIDAQKKNGEI